MAQLVKTLPLMQETEFNPWVRKISWRGKWQPMPVILGLENFMVRGARWATVHGFTKS